MYYNAGVVAVISKVVGLAPGSVRCSFRVLVNSTYNLNFDNFVVGHSEKNRSILLYIGGSH
jgi:hypothetical protein